MFAHTFVDTDAIRALGVANSAHADDLAAVAAPLSSLPVAGSTLGPVGARFVASLVAAAADWARAVAALSDSLAASSRTASAAAAGYDDADQGASVRIAGH